MFEQIMQSVHRKLRNWYVKANDRVRVAKVNYNLRRGKLNAPVTLMIQSARGKHNGQMGE